LKYFEEEKLRNSSANFSSEHVNILLSVKLIHWKTQLVDAITAMSSKLIDSSVNYIILTTMHLITLSFC